MRDRHALVRYLAEAPDRRAALAEPVDRVAAAAGREVAAPEDRAWLAARAAAVRAGLVPA